MNDGRSPSRDGPHYGGRGDRRVEDDWGRPLDSPETRRESPGAAPQGGKPSGRLAVEVEELARKRVLWAQGQYKELHTIMRGFVRLLLWD